MEIIRPYNAEDNNINTEMLKILKNYVKKENTKIETIYIYTLSVTLITQDGRIITMSKAEGSRARTFEKRNYFYMQETIEGKKRRINKENW